MLMWFFFGLYWNRGEIAGGNYGVVGGNLLLFVLLMLLGWRVFGPVLQ
jgi:Na+/proline symporter